jgi:hypothetical protein
VTTCGGLWKKSELMPNINNHSKSKVSWIVYIVLWVVAHHGNTSYGED